MKQDAGLFVIRVNHEWTPINTNKKSSISVHSCPFVVEFFFSMPETPMMMISLVILVCRHF